MYWSASAGGIHGPKTCRKNSQAMAAMVKGFTIQFTNNVTRSPRGRRPTLRTAPKSTFIIMGVIMSQMRTAMGTLIWLPLPNSRPRNPRMSAGASVPIATPTTMHNPTQRLR